MHRSKLHHYLKDINENPNDEITEEPDIETMNLETTFVKFDQCIGIGSIGIGNTKAKAIPMKTEEFYRIYTMYKRPIIDFSFRLQENGKVRRATNIKAIIISKYVSFHIFTYEHFEKKQ